MRKDIGTLLVGVVLALLAWLLPILFPTIEANTGYKLLAVLVILGLLAALWTVWPMPEKINGDKIMSGDDNSIKVGDIIGNQNRVGHEIHHHQPAQRHLTLDLSRGVEQRITRDKPISVVYPSGNNETRILANELHAYLAAQGYEMGGNEAGWFTGSTPEPNMVNITTMNHGEREFWQVYLGPAA